MEWLVRNRGSFTHGTWCKGSLAAGILILAAACSGDSPTESSNFNTPAPIVPVSENPIAFDVDEAGNGSGQCLLADVVDAGFINSGDLQCTSNDVDISFAEVTYYSINDPDPAGGFLPLPTGQEIDCVPGDVIYAVTNAQIQNNASERYDFGLWINPDETAAGGTGALTGNSCLHFNLVVGEPGVANIDNTPDQCGDINATTEVVSVPLDTLTLTCPAGGATSVTVDACAAWSNTTTGSGDRVCPVTEDGEGNPVTSDIGFRLGTTPGTPAKCRCEPLELPINVKGVIRVDKVTVPSGDAQSFDFTPTGTGFTTGFSLTDAATPHSSGPINAGTYTVTETVPTGWDLTGRSCVITGTSDPANFTNTANGVSVNLASGQDVTCTFTNTKRASVTIKKVTVPAESPAVGSFSFSQDFDGTGNFSLGHDGTKVFTNVVAGAAKTVVESDPGPGYALTGIACTGASTYTGTVATRTLSVTPAAGETIVCTFTNTRAGVSVSKTTTETFTRAFTWEVVKTANPSTVTLDPGQVYYQDYDVLADTTGYTDKTFAVGGNITITNTSAFAVSVASVTDAISGVGAATVSCPQTLPYSLASGASLVCTYSLALPDNTTRTNTASVTLGGVADPFTGTESVNFTNVAPTAFEDNCLAVVDAWNGGAPDALGTVCVEGTPHSAGAQTAPYTFDEDRLIPTGAAQCGVVTYNNTATGTTNTSNTTVSDNASVEVTIECPQGCTLTQGYWKTHNPSFRAARNGNGPPPDDNWLNVGPLGENTTFYLSGQTWFQVFWTAPKGNVYYNLAHQYMAAKLNVLDGVTPTTEVANAIAAAEALFATWTPAAAGALKGNNPTRAQFITLAGILGSFNEGSAGVEHCTEDETSASLLR